MELVTAFVGMGSNIGDRLGQIRAAIHALSEADDIRVERISSIYETEAHTLPAQDSQPDHLNAVVQVQTSLSADEFLRALKMIEIEAGRDPVAEDWSSRSIDMDLLIFGDEVKESQDLTVPHPRMAERRFVLQPLSDLVHNLVVPGADGATVSDLLERCSDTMRVERTTHRLELDTRLD